MGSRDRRGRVVGVCWGIGIVLVVVAAVMWWVPWTGADSRCSLATRNDPNIEGACADGVAALLPWFVLVAAGAAVLVVAGAVVVRRRR